MASEATGAGAGQGGHRSHNSALFLRHIPHPSHDLEGAYSHSHASGGTHGGNGGRPGSPRRLHHHTQPLDEEDKVGMYAAAVAVGVISIRATPTFICYPPLKKIK